MPEEGFVWRAVFYSLFLNHHIVNISDQVLSFVKQPASQPTNFNPYCVFLGTYLLVGGAGGGWEIKALFVE